MSGNVLDYRDINKKSMLADVIPLAAPYLIQISSCDFCNFKCRFCFHSQGMGSLKNQGFRPGKMSFETFKVLADQVAEFPERVRAFRFTGFGEPMMNEELPRMIAYAKRHTIADKITMFTNATLLSEEQSRALVDSGIDEIMLSIEALSSEKYFELTGTKVDFPKLVENISYLYSIRGETKVFAKIIDVGLTDEGMFHEVFDTISDLAFVEYASNAYQNVDSTKGIDKNYIGDKPEKLIDVCHLPFYYMYVNWNGDVSSCHLDYTKSIIFGNVLKETMREMWVGKRMNAFRRMQLKRKRYSHPVCGNCNWVSVCACGIYENVIDHAAEELLAHFE